jgi:hypothetical protein
VTSKEEERRSGTQGFRESVTFWMDSSLLYHYNVLDNHVDKTSCGFTWYAVMFDVLL